MKSISLNGEWQYRIGNGAQSTVTVPFSRLPVGRSECVRAFDLTDTSDRVFLKFDGITYYARVWLNGTELGEMLPYCEYEIEITDLARQRGNALKVVLEDIDRAFGPSEGWENFGGIIRDVSLLFREKSYIKSVFFKSKLQKEFHDATFEVEIDADCPTDATFQITLFDGEKECLSYLQAAHATVTASMENVRLWSPAHPNLYTLTVGLVIGDHVSDLYTCEVGFRALSTDRHRFLLNGSPLFLRGVCKHEMVGENGHCPTVAQMEDDLRMIKKMGCNFVRLVHYPHNKKILEIADRIGLFVSEEPGLWWSDTANEEIAAGSKEVLRRTILRDRNHPSIAFWLCFNECQFTERFLIESAAVCRANDPTRMVSGANCMSDEDTLLYYNKCGFDFYTMHPYSDTFAKARNSAKILSDKPLIFTEWGGYYVYDNPHLLSDFMAEMYKLYQCPSDEGALAGAFFWFFAELYDFNRGEPACTDGILHEGLVDRERKPTLIYDAFRRGLKQFDAEDDTKAFWYAPAEVFDNLSTYQRLKGEASDWNDLLEHAKEELLTKGCKRKRKITHGPVLSSLAPLADIPTVVTPQKAVVFEGAKNARELTVIGMTSLLDGYPLGGAYGEEVCVMTIVYENGDTQSISLQNGVHFTTAFAINGSSRIDPIAEKAKRFAYFGHDRNFDNYVMNRLDLPLDPTKKLVRVEFTTKTDRYLPLIYGVFVK